MPEDKEYVTLDEAAKAVGLKRPSLYYYIKKLQIKREQFPYNRHRWIAQADVERIRAAKERPWELADEDTAERHRRRAESMVRLLASSFDEEEPLRESLLAAGPVRRILV